MSTATAPAITAGRWAIDTVHSSVGFAVRHMVVSTFRGRFEEYGGELVLGEDGAPRLEGWVGGGSLAVKDENLAAHLRSPEFFDVERYPELRFSSTRIDVGEGGELELEGELTIKGHTHPVGAHGTISGPHVDIAGNEKIGIGLEAVIDRREYGLEWNAPLPKGGFALENDVKIQVELELVRSEA
jgi:polyisoprenoid-binding protein YceI